jgi:DNA repair exonuclease SbcCD ATPase subunit
MSHADAERQSDSVLVSLKELRNIEDNRIDREQEAERQAEELERRAREQAEEAARQLAERRQRERQRAEQERRERQARQAREERLRLAEAERRARVEAELALERQRLTLEAGVRPARGGPPWLAVGALALVMVTAVGGLGYLLSGATARARELQATLRLERRTTSAQRRQIETMGQRLAQLQSTLVDARAAAASAAHRPSPRQPPAKAARKSKRPKTRPAAGTTPLLPLDACKDSNDPLCGLTRDRRDRP